MKIIKYIFIGFIAASFFYTACDKVDDGLKVIDVQNIPDNIDDTVYFADSVFINQKQVLLEDFTGHKCVNCPEAGIDAESWIEGYEYRLVIYGVHAGFQAFPDPSGNYTADFTNPAGDDIFLYFNEPFNPTATVNRVIYNGNVILFHFNGDWANAVAYEMEKANRINLKLKNTFYPKSNSVLIKVTSTFIEPSVNKFRMVVMIVEDDIVAPQKNNTDFGAGTVPDWLDYVHRNVLRDAISATFGSYITSDGLIEVDEPYENTFLYQISENWVDSNCNIIAYIIEEETDEVIQVAQLGVRTE